MTTRRAFARGAILLPLSLTVVLRTQPSHVVADSAAPGRILHVRNGDVWVWSNGDSKKVMESGIASDARWSPDASQMLFVKSGPSYSDLVIHDINSQAQVPLTFHKPDFEEGTPEYVAAAAWVTSPEWASLGTIGYMTDNESPDGTFQIWLIDGSGGTPFLAPAAQFEDNIDELSLSNDGSLASYVVQERQQDGTSMNRTVLRDLTDGIAYQLAETRNAFDPAISPDAQTIAVAVRAKGISDIFLIDRGSGQLTRVTRSLQATNPCWSPDGTWVAFFRMVDFKFEVWAVPIVAGDPGQPIALFKADDLDSRSGLSWTFTP